MLLIQCNGRAVLTQVMQATNYQRKYTKRKILFLLLLLVIGMFILLLVKPKRHSTTAPATPDPPPGPINDVSIARPVDEQDPGVLPPDALDSAENGAPFVYRSRKSSRSF